MGDSKPKTTGRCKMWQREAYWGILTSWLFAHAELEYHRKNSLCIRHLRDSPKDALNTVLFPYDLVENTVMFHLMTGIHPEKCIIGQFHHTNNIQCTYTNLDAIVYYIPRLYG